MRFAVAVLVCGLVLCHTSAAPSVGSSLLKSLQHKKNINVILSMAERGTTSKILNQLNTHTFSTLDEKRVQIGKSLKAQADASQKDILAFLVSEGAQATQLWITNQVIIRNARVELVEKLMARRDISEIAEETFLPLPQPIAVQILDNIKAGEQWGIINMDVPSVWAQGNRGKGVVVSNIDSGVRGTHEALINNYRGSYGWYDPGGNTTTPNDQLGHGTHTMGTIAGQTNGVGVAPEATWIACKGCSEFSCSRLDLLECGQFIACPKNPQGGDADCTKAPHLVSNSWGGGQGDPWYDEVIKTWRAAGIVPLFSIGNDGPYCKSAESPGDNADVIGVGSITNENVVSRFSSTGPNARGQMKPDIVAPGSNILSASNTADDGYETMSGTSMACPHAAGLTALLLVEKPSLTFNQIKRALEKGALPTVPTGNPCLEIPETTYPNYHVGHGRINAVTAINFTRSL